MDDRTKTAPIAVDRRKFLKTSAAGAAMLAMPGVIRASDKSVQGANGDIRVAVAGLGAKGLSHVRYLLNMKGVRVVCVCDPDTQRQERARKAAVEKSADIETYTDMRDVLDRNDVDAVVLATPNHWHVPGALWTIDAGKDVYIEKPITHTVYEGRVLIDVARRSGRVVFAGTQNRSDSGLMEAFPWIQEGNIGAIQRIVGLCYRNRQGIGLRKEPLAIPESLDYNLWLGPAQDEPIYRNQLHYDWHWMWNTGNGDIGNQGPHEIDLIQWIRGDGELPRHVYSFGGRFAWNDAGKTPNMQIAVFDYGDYPVHFEVRDVCIDPERNAAPVYKGSRVGIIITCEGGEFRGGRGGGWIYSPDGERLQNFKGDGGGNHMRTFIDAVRANDPSKLNVDIEAAHKSTVLMHLANISYRLGDSAGPDAVQERLAERPYMQERFEDLREHLGKWNISLDDTPMTLGSMQEFDPASEQFVAGEKLDAANALLTKPYRRGFSIRRSLWKRLFSG